MPEASNQELLNELHFGILIQYFICGILGLILNSLLLSVLINKIKQKKKNGDIQLCTLVVITDLFVSAGILFRAIAAQYPYNLFEFDSNWCKFDLLSTAQVLVFSGYSLGVMSLERFFLICFNIQMPIYFWFFLIALTWIPQYILSILSAIYDLQILGGTKVACTLVPKGYGYDMYILATILFILSFVSVVMSYFGIMFVKYRQCLNQINLNIPKDQVYKECRTTITKSLVYVTLYVFVYSGKLFIVVYGVIIGKKVTVTMDSVANILIALSMLINAITLLYMNQDVRKSFTAKLKDIKSKILNQSTP